MKAVIIISLIWAVVAVIFIGAIALSGTVITASISDNGDKIDYDVNIGFSVPDVFDISPAPSPTQTYTPTPQTTYTPIQTATAKPTYVPTSAPTYTINPTQIPTQTHTVKPTQTPTLTPTPTATPTPIPTPTISPLEQEGLNKIVGHWEGTKSMIIGSAKFSADFNSDHTASMSGNANALGKNYDLSISGLHWRYEGGDRFIGEKGGKTIVFKCDGSKMETTINPYALGFTDNSLLNQNIALELRRA